MAVLVPDLVYRDAAFHAGLAVDVDEATGRIVRIERGIDADRDDVVHLPGRALIPGFVNAHSHAFQRAIRGRTQWRPLDETVSNFWTWREAMYAAALCLDPDDVYTVSRLCFIEMLRAGITTVGEFHYLHNDVNGSAYDDPTELAQRVIAAAADAGIRIALLNVCYATGGINEPLREEQRRFDTRTSDDFIAMTSALRQRYDTEPLVSVGVAPHSIRAVPRAWLPPLHEWAARHDMPFHMHVSEQIGEVDACVRVYVRRPFELLHEDGLLDDRFTAIHATHIDDGEVGLIAGASATVCACPTTERDLGDGFLRARDLLRAGVKIAIGTDSQTMLDMLEDVRLVEYHERLQRRERVILAERMDDRLEVAPTLLHMASAAGARSLRLSAGVLETGALADIVAIDLEHFTLAGWTADTLAPLLALCAPADVVRDVWVGGRAVVQDRTHAAQEEAVRDFNHTTRRVFARV